MKTARFKLLAVAAGIGAAIAQVAHDKLFGHMARNGLILGLGEIDVEAQLKRIGDDVRDIGTKAMKEAEKNGQVTTEVKAQVDKLLSDFGTLSEGLAKSQQELVAMRDAAKGEKQSAKSLGELAGESKELEAFIKSGGNLRQGVKISLEGVKAVTTATAGAGIAPDFRGDIMSMGRRAFTIRDLMLPGNTNAPAVTYVRESGYTNASAPVAEGAQKPSSDLTLEAIICPSITIASLMPASNQILADIPQLQSYIDGRLRYGLKFAEELQLLKGSGTGSNLGGIYTLAATYAQPTGATVTGETKIDRLRLAMLQSFLAEFPATGIVIHPTDWASIELLKDTQGRYLFGGATATLGPRLWGLPVVETQAMTVNTGLVGAFRPMSQIFDREGINVVIATENKDDFEKNMVTIRCEERLASAVYRPEAFVKIPELQPV